VPTRKLPDWLVRIVGLFDGEVRGQLFELGKVRRLSVPRLRSLSKMFLSKTFCRVVGVHDG